MPAPSTVEAFTTQVLSGDHVGAIRDWYCEDASMQENQGQPRVGRDLLMDGEARTLARVKSVRTELLAPPLVDGDTVVIRWRFTFVPHEGPEKALEEVAWQIWRGDKIWRETFFYDPRQMA